MKNRPVYRDTERKRVLVALGGNIESAVTAALLKSQGLEVLGLHLTMHEPANQAAPRFQGRCNHPVSTQAIRKLCDKLGITMHTVHAEEAYRNDVIDYFLHELLQARRPNPCIRCNVNVRFRALFAKADELGCELVATGHFAQISYNPASGTAHLMRASDLAHDQSYFLHTLQQQQLSRLIFPLGGLSRSMVVKLGEQYDLTLDEFHVAAPGDRTKACLMPLDARAAFVDAYVAPSLRTKGVIRTVEGKVVGSHPGLHCFVLGQKEGFGELTLEEDDKPENYWVVGFDLTNRVLVIGPEALLYQAHLLVSRLSWVRPVNELNGIRCKGRVSPEHEEANCWVTCFENGMARVEFDEPQRCVTVGQSVVFYDENEILGGGIIERLGRS